MFKQKQQLKLLQKISPQQIQFIKLLQIPTATLEKRIKEELEVNPALEEGNMSLTNEDDGDDLGGGPEEPVISESSRDEELKESISEGDKSDSEFSLEDYLQTESSSYKTRIQSSPDDDDDYEAPIVQTQSFYDNLSDQLALIDLDERQHQVAEHLIGSIDEDGYLRRPLDAISHDMVFRYNLKAEPEEIEDILKKIQRFDPPGIGARNLQECLLLQLDRKPSSDAVELAKDIVGNHFDELSKKHFEKLKTMMGINEDQLKDVYDVITKLNPKPGGSTTVEKHEYIIPDFLLSVKDGELDIKLNGRNAPELRVSNSYIKLFQKFQAEQKKKADAKTKETLQFVKQKIESAQWFIDAIRQRQYTLLNTMHAIAAKQKDFFISEGDEKNLRPMILKDIAEEIGMDISTISRVANSKFVQTDFGIFPLKYFFTEGITTEDGTEVSNREVKAILEEIIGKEDKRKPLSDDKISDMLKEKGYNIARRTVAKYREQLNIPVARLRKNL